jgi:hypothetical protein
MILFKTGNVNISLAIKAQTRKNSIACFAFVPCMPWEINVEETLHTRSRGLRIAPDACSRTDGRIMNRFAKNWKM